MPDGDRWLRAALAVMLAMVAMAAYGDLVDAEFLIFDDATYVTENPHVREGLTAEGVRWALTRADVRGTYWQPLTWISHMLDCELFGTRAGAHHLVNVGLHVLNAVLLFLGLRSLTGARWASWVVALLFALHPLNVESVAWVSERKNVLSTAFLLLTIGAWTAWVRRPTVGRYLVTVGLFALGLGAKPMLVTLPFAMLLLDVWPLARVDLPWLQNPHAPAGGRRVGPVRLFVEKLPLIALSAVSATVSLLSLRPAGNIADLVVVPMSVRFGNALISTVRYLDMMVLPHGLSVFYRLPDRVSAWWAVCALVLLLAITGVALAAVRSRPFLAVGWLWFVGTLVPVMGILQVGRWPARADRWMYVPMIGLLVAAVWLASDVLSRLPRRAVLATTVAGALAITLGVLTVAQVRVWHDSWRLFQHALALDPDNPVALTNLGCLYSARGEPQTAIHYLERARAVGSPDPVVLINLGALLSARGEAARSEEYLRDAVALEPDNALAHNALGVALARLGRHREALTHFAEASRLDPKLEDARYNLDRVRRHLAADPEE